MFRESTAVSYLLISERQREKRERDVTADFADLREGFSDSRIRFVRHFKL
jgi:hypothetical protein